jgi:calcineurin-like phosphoesterase family protein
MFQPCRRAARRVAIVVVGGLAISSAIPGDRSGSSSPSERTSHASTRPATLGDDPVLVGAGDIAYCADRRGARATAALLDRIPGTVFTLGDTVYVDGTPEEFANCYDPDWGRHKGRTGLTVAGNHDYNTPGAAGYYGYFGPVAGDPAKGYYDTRIGAWHVVVLNSNCDEVGGCGAGSPQERWLRSVLAASDAACTLALWHHPQFSSATTHRAFPTYQPFWQALYDYGADAVLVASDHVYERFGLQTPQGDADPRYGLRQFTVGTGGRSHQSFRTALPNSEVRNGGTYGVLKLSLHPDSYDWEFVPEAGATFTDSGATACHGAPPAPQAEAGPIVPVGSSSNATRNGRSLTLARPAATQPGDVMVASVVGSQNAGRFTAPPGWAVVRDDSVKSRLRQTIYLKIAGPEEPESYTWLLPKRQQVAGGLTAYSGVDPARPVEKHSAYVTRKRGTAVTGPSIKVSSAPVRLIHFAAVNAEGTLRAPPAMSQRWLAAAPSGSANDALASASDEPRPEPGSTGPWVATATEAGARIGVLLALRAAP